MCVYKPQNFNIIHQQNLAFVVIRFRKLFLKIFCFVARFCCFKPGYFKWMKSQWIFRLKLCYASFRKVNKMHMQIRGLLRSTFCIHLSFFTFTYKHLKLKIIVYRGCFPPAFKWILSSFLWYTYFYSKITPSPPFCSLK